MTLAPKTAVVALFCVLGTVMTFLVTAAQMKIATAIDILFWVVYDFENFMIVNVIQNLFLIFLPLIEFYLEIIKKRTGGAFVSKGNNIVLPKL